MQGGGTRISKGEGSAAMQISQHDRHTTKLGQKRRTPVHTCGFTVQQGDGGATAAPWHASTCVHLRTWHRCSPRWRRCRCGGCGSMRCCRRLQSLCCTAVCAAATNACGARGRHERHLVRDTLERGIAAQVQCWAAGAAQQLTQVPRARSMCIVCVATLLCDAAYVEGAL